MTRTSTSSTDQPRLDSETVRCRLLGNPVRREALSVLADLQSPITVETLAAAVQDRRAGDDPAEGDASLRLTLHHNHLPKLAAHDWIEYNAETNTVVENDVTEELLHPF